MSWIIAVDKREREVLQHVELEREGKVEFHPEHLTTGDFILFYNTTPLYVIERKTWSDLAASIKDGRMNNIEKLRAYREQTGARIAYLMEGKTPEPTGSVDNIPYKCLRAHLDHLMYRDGVQELYTTSTADTARRLVELTLNLSTLPVADNSTVDGLSIAKQKITLTDNEMRMKMWCAIPHIAGKTAEKLVESNYTLKYVYERRQDADFVVELNHKIGSARAETLLSALNTPQVVAQVFGAISGITISTALSILRECSLQDLMGNWVQCEERLIRLPVGKSTLGRARVNKIKRLLGHE